MDEIKDQDMIFILGIEWVVVVRLEGLSSSEKAAVH